jgi:hypothetical protein
VSLPLEAVVVRPDVDVLFREHDNVSFREVMKVSSQLVNNDLVAGLEQSQFCRTCGDHFFSGKANRPANRRRTQMLGG